MTSYTGTFNRTNSVMTDTATLGRVLTEREKIERYRKDKRFLMRLAILAMAGLFILIGLRAYGASIQHENNILVSENEYLQAEIDSLKTQIVEETKVTKIEKIATEEYGMVYPTSENCIRISDTEEGKENLAAVIRSGAYN